ncbi:MAG: hypothetical protein K8R02_07375 [Anaerohalosphaeraceae bacterium]|nr:hypothetical protein [Anaerohalosphaeraceae bacterium]
MIKTLRITSILVGLAALGFVAFIASQGMQTDESIEEFLSSPGIAEQMKGSSTTKTADSGQDSPLIRQAKAFALRINPPPPPVAKTPRPTTPRTPKKPPRPKVAAVTANFTLLGTSSHLDDENESWALINEVGKGVRWVKQGQSIGHLMIEGIGSGVVLINDRGNTYELAVKRETKPDYVKSYSGQLPEKSPDRSWQTGSVREVVSSVIEPAVPPAAPSAAPPSAENVKENIEWLKRLQADPAMAELSGDDANSLGGFGEILKSLEKDLKNIETDKNKPLDKKEVLNENKPRIKFDDEEGKVQYRSENEVGSDAEARKKAMEDLMKRRRSRSRR